MCVGPQLLGLFGITVKGMKRQTGIFKILRKTHGKIKHNKAGNVCLNDNIVLLASVFPMIMLPAAPNKLKWFCYNPIVNNKHH